MALEQRNYDPAIMQGASHNINIDLGDLLDVNENEILEFDAVASAITYIRVANAATGGNPVLSAQGEADTGLEFHTADDEQLLILEAVAAGVNELTISNAATGNNPTVDATGEANTGITFRNSESEEILILDSVATSVNEITVRSAAAGNKPIIAATGEADNGIEFHNDQAEEILILASAATSINEVTITSSAAGTGPSIAATGGDTDIDVVLTPKGAGNVRLSLGGLEEPLEALTAASPTLVAYGVATLDSTSNGITGTLGSGTFIGQIKTIVMIEASNSSTVSITNHQTSDPEVATFDALDETGVFMWTGTEWITIFASCTFV